MAHALALQVRLMALGSGVSGCLAKTQGAGAACPIARPALRGLLIAFAPGMAAMVSTLGEKQPAVISAFIKRLEKAHGAGENRSVLLAAGLDREKESG